MPHRSTAGNANTTTWLRKVLICSYRDSGAVLRECLIARKGVVVSLCLMTLSGGVVRADEPTFDFDIPEQRADDALILLGEQADATVLFQYDMATQHDANRLQGEYTLSEAVGILLADSGLKAEFGEQGHLYISVEETEREGDDVSTGKKAGLAAFFAAVFSVGAGAQNGETADETATELEEIVVTGSQIRGGSQTSQVVIVDRDDIELTGLSTVQDLLQTLPQNYGGSQNEVTTVAGDFGGNIGRGSSVDLRGLGADSTLILINGHRHSVAGRGNFVDVSTIPLVAVERIEVLADGASALYGSDAVGGVVNFILRNNYEGAETKVRISPDLGADFREIGISQALGKSWGSGNIVFAYEYYDRSRLAAADRGYAADSDLSALGGDNFSSTESNPGSITSPGSFAIPAGQDGTTLSESDLIVGRNNFQNQRLQTDLLPQQERHSLFIATTQAVGDIGEFFLEARYSDREFLIRDTAMATALSVPETNAYRQQNGLFPGSGDIEISYSFLEDLGPTLSSGSTAAFDFGIGLRWDFLSSWSGEVYAQLSRQDDESLSTNALRTDRLSAALASSELETAFNPFADGTNTNSAVLADLQGFATEDIENELSTIAARADGELFSIPGGQLKLAVGVEYRKEEFRPGGVTLVSGSIPEPRVSPAGDRDVFAMFAETKIPIIGERNSLPIAEKFELTLALRHEDYSDFGTATNPKYGLLWAPTPGVLFRASAGDSFRAPFFLDLLQRQVGFTFPVPNTVDPLATDGTTNTLFLRGGNPNLQPEEASTWTTGIAISPSSVPGFTAELGYYDIEYKGRVANILNVFLPFLDPDTFGSVLTRNPSQQLVDGLISGLDLFAGVPPSPGAIEAIVDDRLVNLSRQEIRGVDLSLEYETPSDRGQWVFGLSASYMIAFEEAFTNSAPASDRAGTLGRPAELRMRGKVLWSRDRFGSAVFVNFTDDYVDTASSPVRSVDSQTTVDLSLNYSMPEIADFSELRMSLVLQNIFDEEPPFVNNLGFGFDSANANVLERTAALQLTANW